MNYFSIYYFPTILKLVFLLFYFLLPSEGERDLWRVDRSAAHKVD